MSRRDIDLWRPEFTPAGEMFGLSRRLNQLMDMFYSPEELGAATECDMDETDSHYLISLDLPGVRKEDIQVHAEGNRLSIHAERKEEEREGRGKKSSSRRFFGSFDRSFTLPESIEAEKIEGNFRNGVLELAIPKREKAKARPITVGEGKESFFDRFLGKKGERTEQREKEKRPEAKTEKAA